MILRCLLRRNPKSRMKANPRIMLLFVYLFVCYYLFCFFDVDVRSLSNNQAAEPTTNQKVEIQSMWGTTGQGAILSDDSTSQQSTKTSPKVR